MVMSSCGCVHYDSFECLSQRYRTGLSMARVMAGCGCKCHTPGPGMLITKEQWQKNRESMARPVRPPRAGEIRDPRIQKLMKGGE